MKWTQIELFLDKYIFFSIILDVNVGLSPTGNMFDPGGILGASMVLVDLGGVTGHTLDLVDLSIDFLDAAVSLWTQGRLGVPRGWHGRHPELGGPQHSLLRCSGVFIDPGASLGPFVVLVYPWGWHGHHPELGGPQHQLVRCCSVFIDNVYTKNAIYVVVIMENSNCSKMYSLFNYARCNFMLCSFVKSSFTTSFVA